MDPNGHSNTILFPLLATDGRLYSGESQSILLVWSSQIQFLLTWRLGNWFWYEALWEPLLVFPKSQIQRRKEFWCIHPCEACSGSLWQCSWATQSCHRMSSPRACRWERYPPAPTWSEWPLSVLRQLPVAASRVAPSCQKMPSQEKEQTIEEQSSSWCVQPDYRTTLCTGWTTSVTYIRSPG